MCPIIYPWYQGFQNRCLYSQALIGTRDGGGDEANCFLKISKRKLCFINGTKSDKKFYFGAKRPSGLDCHDSRIPKLISLCSGFSWDQRYIEVPVSEQLFVPLISWWGIILKDSKISYI